MALGSVALGVVHGAQVDGHFFQTAMQFGHYSQNGEWVRLSGALKEAADHIDDQDLATKYRQIADDPLFYGDFVGVRSGPLLSMGRGALCQSFLDQTNSPWLFMVDSDMTFEPSVIAEMVQLAESQDLQVVAGVAWIVWTDRQGNIAKKVPNVYKAVQFGDGEYLVPITEEELPKNELCRVGGCGAAAMLVHRDVLIKIRNEQLDHQPFWFHHLPTPNGDQYGEDTSFALRIRRAGIDIWVHTGARFGHAKTTIHYGNLEGATSNG